MYCAVYYTNSVGGPSFCFDVQTTLDYGFLADIFFFFQLKSSFVQT